MPRVSIITAAFQAGSTIGRTLASVRAQTFTDFEHIIVDDGSTDDTSAIAGQEAKDDPRIRLLRQSNAGAGAARNAGLAQARGDWILFLDADDTLSPDHLSRLMTHSRPGVDAICCGYVRVGPGGEVISRHPAPELVKGRFADVTEGPPVILHAILLARPMFDRTGAFDTALRTNEDWDLWVRLTRAGAVIAREPRALAAYWTSPGSLTRGGRRMVEDAATVLRRMTKPDPRLHAPLALYKDGMAVRDVSGRILQAAVWSVAAAASVGETPARLEDIVEPLTGIEGWRDALAAAVLAGLAVGSGRRHDDLLANRAIFMDPLTQGLASLEVAAGAPGLAGHLVERLETDLVRTARLRAPAQMGSTYAVPAGWLLSRTPPPPPGTERILLKIGFVRPRSAGLFSLGTNEIASRHAIVAAITRTISKRLSDVFKRTLSLTGNRRVQHTGGDMGTAD